VADVQRAGRVGGDELDLNLVRSAELGASEPVACDQDGADDVDLGPHHLGPADQTRSRQLGEQLVGYLAWILPQRLGQLHRQVGGEIAMCRITRSFNVDRRVSRHRRNACQRLP